MSDIRARARMSALSARIGRNTYKSLPRNSSLPSTRFPARKDPFLFHNLSTARRDRPSSDWRSRNMRARFQTSRTAMATHRWQWTLDHSGTTAPSTESRSYQEQAKPTNQWTPQFWMDQACWRNRICAHRVVGIHKSSCCNQVEGKVSRNHHQYSKGSPSMVPGHRFSERSQKRRLEFLHRVHNRPSCSEEMTWHRSPQFAQQTSQ